MPTSETLLASALAQIWSSFVKTILAIIQPTKLKPVRDALANIGVERLTICDAHGYGRQRGQTEKYRGVEYKANLLRKVALEIVVNDDFLDRTIETIKRVARHGAEGNIGDGKIFVIPTDAAIDLAGGIRGPEAV